MRECGEVSLLMLFIGPIAYVCFAFMKALKYYDPPYLKVIVPKVILRVLRKGCVGCKSTIRCMLCLSSHEPFVLLSSLQYRSFDLQGFSRMLHS